MTLPSDGDGIAVRRHAMRNLHVVTTRVRPVILASTVQVPLPGLLGPDLGAWLGLMLAIRSFGPVPAPCALPSAWGTAAPLLALLPP